MPWSPKTRTRSGGGNISVSGPGSDSPIIVRARIEGLEKTSAEFKAARRRFNAALRTVLQTAGERTVLPVIKLKFKRLTGRFANSLYVKRDRTTVFIGSRMRGGENRAVGWIDFGGRHPLHKRRRKGLYVIVDELNKRQPVINEAILVGLTKTFDPLEHRP
jgi:hypothetical protein